MGFYLLSPDGTKIVGIGKSGPEWTQTFAADNPDAPYGWLSIADDDARVTAWQTAQTAAATAATLRADLAESDKTIDRIVEAVALGLTTWGAPDVVAWVNYRRSLRSGTAATKPAYPAGT